MVFRATVVVTRTVTVTAEAVVLDAGVVRVTRFWIWWKGR